MTAAARPRLRWTFLPYILTRRWYSISPWSAACSPAYVNTPPLTNAPPGPGEQDDGDAIEEEGEDDEDAIEEDDDDDDDGAGDNVDEDVLRT